MILAEDTPDRWPSADQASEAELYVENFTEQSKRWWSALEHVDRAEITFQRITTLAELFATNLHVELRALTSGHPEAARLLTVLAERGQWSIPDVFDRLVSIDTKTSTDGSILTSATSEPIEDDRADTPASKATPSIEVSPLIAKWRDRLRNSEFDTTLGARSVKETFGSFQAGRYGNVIKEAPSAWHWVAAQKTNRDIDALMAVYAWAHADSSVEGIGHERIEALALLLQAWSRLLERVPSLETSIDRWIAAVLTDKTVNEVISGELIIVILRVAKSAPGSVERERFGLLLRISDATILVQRIWNHFRGSPEQAKARTALLLLLFDLADDQALHHLFMLTGDKQKYLIAFTALAKRASAEPSTRLLGAIQQNLLRLSELKERPFRDYAQRIAGRLRYATGRRRSGHSHRTRSRAASSGRVPTTYHT